MPEPDSEQSLTDLISATRPDARSADAPPSFMTPLSHRPQPEPSAMAQLPGESTTTPRPEESVTPPEYANPIGHPDRVHVEPGMVNALIADLDSIASSQAQARAEVAPPVSGGLPGSDVEQSCIAAEAALNSALETIRSRFDTARENTNTSLETDLRTDAENAAAIGSAGTP